MTEKCPQCNEKVDVLFTQTANPLSTSTMSLSGSTTVDHGLAYPPTNITYKCSNPKCWVTKINESWE